MFRHSNTLILLNIFLGLLTQSNSVLASKAENKNKQNINSINQQLVINEHLTSVYFGSGLTLDFTIGLGSGAFHYANDPDDVVYFITDRGPNIRCKDAIKRLKKELCDQGKIFPTPAYAPRIYKLQLQKKLHSNAGQNYKVLQMLEIKNDNNDIITGMPNDLKVTDREFGFDQYGKPIKLDNDGIDSEALVRLSDGSFWVAEEYAPSLLHIDKQGKILERIVPSTVAKDLQTAHYRISGKLPSILRKRMLNRGIEGLALSRDELYLYFILQSPLANPDRNAYKNSANIRLFKVLLSDGNFSTIQAEYLYQLDQPESFGDIDSGQGDVKRTSDGKFQYLKKHKIKISEMTVLPSGDLIVLERISKTTKLYKIDFQDASNIFGSKYDDESTRPSLEQLQSPQLAGIRAVKKQLVFNSMFDAPNLPRKIEGIASLENGQLILINDNDFNGNVIIQASFINLPQGKQVDKNVISHELSKLDL